MSTSSASIQMSSGSLPPVLGSPASSSSSNKYAPAPMKLSDCDLRIKRIAASYKLENAIEARWLGRILPPPTDFSAPNLIYAKNSKDYALCPLYFEKLNQPEKAALAYLNLAELQLKEDKAQGALATLETARKISPHPMKIDAVLWALRLGASPSQEQIDAALAAAAKLDPEEAISIYKHVIAVSPCQLEAYKALGPLLDNNAEKRNIFLQAVEFAKRAGAADLVESFAREAEAPVPVYPNSMSQSDWENPAAFMKRLPPMPSRLTKFLEGPCPYKKGEIAKNTHIVAPLIRSITLDGGSVPRTLEALDVLDRNSGGGGIYNFCSSNMKKPIAPEVEFEWVVMTNEALPGSIEEPSYKEQSAEPYGYEVPDALTAGTCMLWEKRLSGESLFDKTYIRCSDWLSDIYDRTYVGGPGKALGVRNNILASGYPVGVAGIRKFSVHET